MDLTTAANARCLFEEAADEGYGDKDMSAVVEIDPVEVIEILAVQGRRSVTCIEYCG